MIKDKKLSAISENFFLFDKKLSEYPWTLKASADIDLSGLIYSWKTFFVGIWSFNSMHPISTILCFCSIDKQSLQFQGIFLMQDWYVQQFL